MTCVGHHPGQPVEPEVGLLCKGCYRRLCSQIAMLPAVVHWLHAHLAAGGSAWAGEQRVTGSKEPPTPLRMDVLDLIGPTNGDRIPTAAEEDWLGYDNIPDLVLSWARQIAEVQGDRVPTGDLTVVCGWLGEQAGWIAQQDWVDEMLDQLHEVHCNAGRVAPWREEQLRDRTEPCMQCGVLAQVQHVAHGRVVCEPRLGGCGREREVTEYEWNTRHLRQRGKAAS